MGSLILLAAAVAPFLLWPIELFLPYPFIIEEVFKAVFVFFMLDIGNNLTKIKLAGLSGFIFAFSESVFYLFNFLAAGNLQTFLERLFLTTLIHTFTFLLILIPALKKKIFILIGVFLASLSHYFYNLLVGSIRF